jgi:hypothetical protein
MHVQCGSGVHGTVGGKLNARTAQYELVELHMFRLKRLRLPGHSDGTVGCRIVFPIV